MITKIVKLTFGLIDTTIIITFATLFGPANDQVVYNVPQLVSVVATMCHYVSLAFAVVWLFCSFVLLMISCSPRIINYNARTRNHPLKYNKYTHLAIVVFCTAIILHGNLFVGWSWLIFLASYHIFKFLVDAKIKEAQ